MSEHTEATSWWADAHKQPREAFYVACAREQARVAREGEALAVTASQMARHRRPRSQRSKDEGA